MPSYLVELDGGVVVASIEVEDSKCSNCVYANDVPRSKGARAKQHEGQMDIATPCTRHIQLAPFQFSVYEPAEDTFLLLDSLQQDYQLLLAVKPSIILELG